MNAIPRDKKQENQHSIDRISRRDMLATSTSVLAAASISNSALITPAQAQPNAPVPTATFSSEDLTQRTTQRRAVEAAIWGMPIINFDAMRQAFFRDAKAAYGDIMFWSKPGSWKLQCLTPNTSVRYAFSFINTSEAGPVVVELPATADAALNGTIIDAWQVPQTDVGIAGEDQGKGGKYLLLPPDHQGYVPPGYIGVPMKTSNGFVGLRVIIKSEDEATVRNALAYLRLIRIYPLSKSAAPPQSTFIDMADTVWDAVARFDDSFYASLARMVSEEPVQPRDAAMMGMLRTLGIDKAKDFKPDEPTRAGLKAAAEEAHAWFMDRLVTYGDHYWPDSKWDVPAAAIGPKSGFTWEANGILDVDARGIAFFSFFCPPKKLGTGQFYLVTFFDGKAQRLRGGENYRLRVPGDVPVTQFWSATVYDHATCALIRNVARPSMDSYDTRASKNADGSTDVYFGPTAPKGLEANWIPTAAGNDWFPYFRFYGPQQPLFAKTWRLPDIDKMS
jgi:hypothetical protein